MWKKFLEKSTGIIILSSTYTSCLYAFINAYFSQSKSTLITINSYGEANIELILLLVTLPLVLKYIVKEIRDCLPR